MKKIHIVMIGFIYLFLVSCSSMKIEFEEDSIFYNGGVVYIYLDDKTDKISKYEVYINDGDTEVALTNHLKTRFGIEEGQTKIEIIEGNKRVSISLFLNKLNSYYLKVTKNNKDDINILQVQKTSIDESIKETPLYIDEEAKKKAKKEKVREIISDYGEEPIAQENNTIVDENTKTPDNGDTIFYYNAEEGE